MKGPTRTKWHKTQEGNFNTRTSFLPKKLNNFKCVLDGQFFKGFVITGTYDICLQTSDTMHSGWHVKGPSETIK